MTSFTTVICFILALFFAPLFLSVPSQATAPALFLVGVMMMPGIRDIDFTNFINAIPCFICIAAMPMAYSISDGILLSLITYVLLRIFSGRWKELSVGSCILCVLFLLKYILL